MPCTIRPLFGRPPFVSIRLMHTSHLPTFCCYILHINPFPPPIFPLPTHTIPSPSVPPTPPPPTSTPAFPLSAQASPTSVSPHRVGLPSSASASPSAPASLPLPPPTLAWIDGEIVSIKNNEVHVQTSNGKKVTTDKSKAFPKDMEAPPGGVDDMTRLSYSHEPGVLQNLATLCVDQTESGPIILEGHEGEATSVD